MEDNNTHILLVEDEVLIAMVEQQQLKKKGYRVRHVDTGEQAVEAVIAGKTPIDLVLMDINLGPGIDGTEAAQQILGYKDFPVVFLSSHTEPKIVEKTEKITSYGYVVKNSGIVVLDASIKMALKLFDAKTKHKQAEEESTRFKTISENAVYGTAITDLQGNLVYVNKFFAHVHGYEPEELIGRNLSLFHTKKQMQEVHRIINSMLELGNFAPIHAWHVNRDGTEFPMLMSGVVIKNEKGIPEYLASTAIDLTNLHAVEENYKTLFNEMLNGFALHEIILDEAGSPLDYRFLEVNPSFESITGLKAASLVGRTVLEVLPGTEKCWIEIYGKVALWGEPVFFENYSSELNKYFEVTAFCPEYGRFATIFQDITTRKKSEQIIRLRFSLLEFSATHSLEEVLQKTLDEVEIVSDSVISFYHFLDKDQKTLSIQNWSTRTLAKFCKAEGKGMHYGVNEAGVWVDCIRQKGPVIHNDYISLPHRKGLPEGHAPVIRELVVPVIRADKIVAVLGVGNKPQNYTSEDVELVSYLADVTWELIERKQIEEKLEQSHDRFQSLVTNIPGITYRCQYDNNWTMLFISSQIDTVTGYYAEELIKNAKTSYGSLIHPADRSAVTKAIAAAVKENKSWEIEYRVYHKNGSIRWAYEKGTAIHDSHGKVKYLDGIILDLTDRKQGKDKTGK